MARILIIDDNETMREGLGATVRRMGHEAVMASSGAEGLTHVVATTGRPPVEFVITDLKMEGVGGLDVVKAVRERDPDCPVMIVTAFGTVETAVEAMRLGAVNYVPKPADADEVLEAFDKPKGAPQGDEPLAPSLARAEWEHINRVLSDCGGNISEAARRLALHRRTLQRKLNKYPPSH